MDLTNKTQLIQYLRQHGLYTKKSLGQNFLVDRKALDQIVAAADLSSNDCVIEVGPGLGVLTEELVARAGRVTAIELDQKLAELLSERMNQDDDGLQKNVILNDAAGSEESRHQPHASRRLSSLDPSIASRTPQDDTKGEFIVISSSILNANIAEITKDYPSYKVVANIPYYITSKILRLFLEQVEKKPSVIVLLTQKEVAERVCAKPGDMSLLAVSVQVYGEPEIVGIVKRDSFFPAPAVDSAILRIKVESGKRKVEGGKDFFRCVHVGFAARRKTLLNNLAAGYHLDKKTVLGILVSVGLNENARAQELSIEKWGELCFKLNPKSKDQNPK